MALSLAKQDKAVARPLKVLVPMIKEELQAGEQAGLQHYRRAGEMLIEAKEQVEMGHWGDWLEDHFHLTANTARVYMRLARAPQKNAGVRFENLSQFLGDKRVNHEPAYSEPVKAALPDPALKERLMQDTQKRTEEAKLARELGLKLIDIGYKVLATQLHPDKGGSKEAMERLNSVRERLKKALPA